MGFEKSREPRFPRGRPPASRRPRAAGVPCPVSARRIPEMAGKRPGRRRYRAATARVLPRRLARRGDHGRGESGQNSVENSAMWLPPPRCTVTAQLQTAASRGNIVFASSSLKPVPKRIAVALVYASKGFVTRQLAAHVGERDATIAVARA